MTQSIPPFEADRTSVAPAPEHCWISKGSTLNLLPGPLLKQRRATADLLDAVTMVTAQSRKMLERSAASWNTRAELLQSKEAETETSFTAFKLTASEAAEDAAYLRL